MVLLCMVAGLVVVASLDPDMACYVVLRRFGSRMGGKIDRAVPHSGLVANDHSPADDLHRLDDLEGEPDS